MTGCDAFTYRATGFLVSVQAVSITIGNVTSQTATITSVDTSKAFIIQAGFNTQVATKNGATMFPRIELTNSTTVTVYRNTANVSEITFNAYVVEFDSRFIKSIQQGTVTAALASSGTTTISSVNTANSALFWLGSTSDDTSVNLNQYMCTVDLTDATTVTVNVRASLSTNICGFVVVEFWPQVIQRIQGGSISATSSTATSFSTTITAVNLDNTFLAYGGQNASAVNFNSAYCRISHTDSTTVTAVRDGTASNNRLIHFRSVEFVPGVLASPVQRATITQTSAADGDTTITTVNTSKTAIHFTGNSSTGTTDPSASLVATSLTSSTNVRGATRIGATANTRISRVGVLEFT